MATDQLPEAPPVERRPLEPGMLDRVTRGVTNVIAGVKQLWMGPEEPVAPVAQADTRGRQFDYPVGYNLRISPRSGEAIDFNSLRALADGYYLVRLAIETRKDQMVKLKHGIRPRSENPTETEIARAAEIQTQLAFPDREHTYQAWMRMLLEDYLVIDAPAVEPRRTMSGAPFSLDPVDGATIARKIDGTGRTPAPPEPAYQQIIKGVPGNNLTTDELIYFPRNLRTNRVYGFSPVEQIVYIVNIAMRRDLSKLQYYTEGTVPDALGELPEGWTTGQIREFQDYWDGLMNTTAVRRKLKFTPALKQMHWTKADILKDDYDEWLARIVCYAFSLPPNAFVTAVNQKTGETLQDSAMEEGLVGMMGWWKDFMDLVLAKYFDAPDMEHAWLEDDTEDPMLRAQADGQDTSNMILGVDEVRATRGLEALGIPPFLRLPTGIITVEEFKAGVRVPTNTGAAANEFRADGLDEPAPLSASQQAQVDRLSAFYKARKKKVLTRRQVRYAKARDELAGRIERFLTAEGVRIGREIAAAVPSLELRGGPIGKADDPERFGLADVKRVVGGVDFGGWTVLVDELDAASGPMMARQASASLAQLGVGPDEEGIIRASERVVEWSRERAAEMVGMRRLPDGRLVENPRAEWAITETTRDDLRSIVTRALEEGMTNDELVEAIAESGAFSAERADTIARTELALANMQATQIAWEESGVVTGKVWLLSNDHVPSEDGLEVCDVNAAAGEVPLHELFPGADQTPPAHPYCQCDVAAVVPEVPG